jgi:precorrin-6B methylase 2
MREVYRLPETFTGEDLGRPLLLNTGLWVCRMDEGWAKKVHFTVNDRICFDPEKDHYFAQVEPEDWYFSRLLHELGLKVGCTRKVELGHRGNALYGNAHPWGTWEYDEVYAKGSLLGPRDPDDWFPHDAAGWLSEREGRRLAELAVGGSALEIGSYCGRSTICLARGAKSVGVVDTFDGRGTDQPGDTFPLFRSNLRRYGVADRVKVYKGTSEEVLPKLPPVYDLVFVDGSHDHDSVLRDAGLAAAVLRPGGLLAFHDFGRAGDEGVTRAVSSVLAAGGELLETCDTLAVVRPPAGRAADRELEPAGGICDGV